MKIKRITAAILAAAMCLSLTMTSFAETEDVVEDEAPSSEMIAPPYTPGGGSQASNTDVNLQTALTKVKKRITIPSNLTEFTYSTSTSNSITTYRFNWSKDSKNSSGIKPLLDSEGRETIGMSATIVGDIITRYSKNYSYSADSQYGSGAKLGKIPVSSFETYAKNGVAKLNPGMSSQITFSKPSASLYSQAVSVQFQRTENGVDVSNNTGRIVFDKNTGDITNFSVSWWNDATFKSPETKITEEAMQTAYEKAIALEKQYVIKRDYETKKITAAITYTPASNYEFDAFTGKKSTMWEDYAKAMQTTGMVEDPATGEGMASDEAMLNDVAVAAEDSEVSFSAAELLAIKENEDMIKRDEATAIILKDPYIGLTTKYQLSSGQLYTKNDFGVTNYWDLRYLINTDDRYDSISVKLDADTGAVLSFSKYGYDKVKSANAQTLVKLDETAADKTAEEAFAYYMGDKYDEYKNSKYNDAEIYEEDGKGNKFLTSKSYYKERYYEDIRVEGEYANISVGAKGEITRFDYQYTEVDFPDSKVLTQAAAYEKLWAQRDFELYYSGFVGRNGKAVTYLMYQLDSFTLNAKTGNLSDYYGDPLETYEKSNIVYNDIITSKYKTAVDTLQAYGVYLEPTNGNFAASSGITQGDFNKLIGNLYGSASLSAAQAKKMLTKADAAKLYVQATGGEKYAEMKGVFKSPYADVPENNAYVGYIAIAKAEGVFESGGNFAPNSNLTRGDAILMIYEMVK
jgi:hypothetical protein